ncbi:glycoside hydrolase family 3 C-terminal domain-containing protein [Streptomyces sp. NBC_00859]|uniref:glycoside hydrolase family 3 C-terminal domain-containing protein n=1 Tax=Streptomyces sp. NBC_00859 TaxID=2903682 RepID=UPI00386DB422|nr:glycoside hydrolase family 3 C-terminal domain-containing protein [Streptomyces sp. NBC_00859]
MNVNRRSVLKLAGAGTVAASVGTVASATGAAAAVRSGAAAGPVRTAATSVPGSAEAAAKAAALIARMTLDEKIALLHGGSGGTGYAGAVPANARLDIPALYLGDGPGGVGNGSKGVTQWPDCKTLAATWDPGTARSYGDAYGAEQAAKGHNIALAPCINILRVPYWGRSFETFTEDPYLNAELAASVVEGIQAHPVMATVKHFAANNQEVLRGSIDVVVSQRALQEIYYPGFRAAVQRGGAGAVMTSYNKVNGAWSHENRTAVQDTLRDAWGFDGLVMSDWGGTHSTLLTARAGSDMEMPGSTYLGTKLKDAVAAGTVSEATVDTMAGHVLTAMYRTGLFDHRLPDPATVLSKVVSSDAHLQLARSISVQGSVLLKNAQQLLPFARPASVAVIGDAADAGARTHGGGSGAVSANGTVVTPLAGIKARAGDIPVTYTKDLAGAADAARAADVAVVVAADYTSEGSDRTTLALPNGQDELIAAVVAANPCTVVVLNTSGSVLMPWIDGAGAVIANWYGGQEQGNALAAMLFGDAEPGGRLPETFPASEEQGPAKTTVQYPGDGVQVYYDEGLAVGYRWYESSGEKPLFPFGHGLSYTTFQLSGLSLERARDGYRASVAIRNTGHRTGSEVVQLYLTAPDAAGEPSRQLKAFEKVTLKPGESRRVSLALPREAFAVWQTSKTGWTVVPGTYTVSVGRSSADLPLETKVRIG